MKRLVLPLLALACAWCPAAGRADSIWDRRTPTNGYLFVDNRARMIGDLLTIVINEETDIDQREERDMEKKKSIGLGFGLKGKSAGNVLTRNVSAEMEGTAHADHEYKGKADYTSDRRLADRMTVVVIDVMPNGNLVIEGIRKRMVSGEERILHVAGYVRPLDISPANILQSQFIGDLKVWYEGKGIDSKYTQPGWMTRIIHAVSPF